MKKRIIKQIFIFLVITLCISCQKRELDNVQPDIDNSDSMPELIFNSAGIPVSQLEQKEERTLQEIIESYVTQRSFAFQIEGNFTGSGNREIIAFYGRNGSASMAGALNTVFCFVTDASRENIENVYPVNYMTLAINNRSEADSGFIEAVEIGREIIWGDRIIGRVGDFNRNGREELYLYFESGMNAGLRFIEFDRTEFVDILDTGFVSASYIRGADPKERTIDIRIEYGTDNPMLVSNNKYIWDEITQRYEILTTELKKYWWNNVTREWEDITE
jgi:hypothetical protein